MTITIENVLNQLQDETLETTTLSSCDTIATSHNNSIITLDTINNIEGTGCNQISIPLNTTGLIATFKLDDLRLDKYEKLKLSIYSDNLIDNGDISIILSDSEECNSILEQLNAGSINIDQWVSKSIEILDPENLIGLMSLGIQLNNVFPNELILKIDNIRAYTSKYSTTQKDVESKINSAILKATNYLERTEAPINNPSFDDAVTEWAAGLVFNKIYDAQGQEAGSYHRGMALIRSAKETLDSMKGDPNQDGKTDVHFLTAVSTPDSG